MDEFKDYKEYVRKVSFLLKPVTEEDIINWNLANKETPWELTFVVLPIHYLENNSTKIGDYLMLRKYENKKPLLIEQKEFEKTFTLKNKEYDKRKQTYRHKIRIVGSMYFRPIKRHSCIHIASENQ